jgi:hypothetical protein
MFIRIKQRRLKSSDDGDFSLRVYLVENRRIKGDPRQRVVAYLGSIRQSQIKIANQRDHCIHVAAKRIRSISSDFRQHSRLIQSMIKLIVAQRYPTGDSRESSYQNSPQEDYAKKAAENMAESRAALELTREVLASIHIARDRSAGG